MLRTENGSWGTEEATLHFRYFRHDNTEKRPVLVFLHDALGSIAQWRDFPQLLAERTGLDALPSVRHEYLARAAAGDLSEDAAQVAIAAQLPAIPITQGVRVVFVRGTISGFGLDDSLPLDLGRLRR